MTVNRKSSTEVNSTDVVEVLSRGSRVYLDIELLMPMLPIVHRVKSFTRPESKSRRVPNMESLDRNRHSKATGMLPSVSYKFLDIDIVCTLRSQWKWRMTTKDLELYGNQVSLLGVGLFLNEEALARAELLSISRESIERQSGIRTFEAAREQKEDVRTPCGTTSVNSGNNSEASSTTSSYHIRTTIDHSLKPTKSGSLVRLLSPLNTALAYEALKLDLDDDAI